MSSQPQYVIPNPLYGVTNLLIQPSRQSRDSKVLLFPL